MITLHLEWVLSSLIQMDQTGFIKNRSSFDNKRLMSNIYLAKQMDFPVISFFFRCRKSFRWMALSDCSFAQKKII